MKYSKQCKNLSREHKLANTKNIKIASAFSNCLEADTVVAFSSLHRLKARWFKVIISTINTYLA